MDYTLCYEVCVVYCWCSFCFWCEMEETTSTLIMKICVQIWKVCRIIEARWKFHNEASGLYPWFCVDKKMMKKNCEGLKVLDWKCSTSLLDWNVCVYGDKRFKIAIFVLSPLMFLLFWKNMKFGYCFNPCGVRLTFDWNELELNLL